MSTDHLHPQARQIIDAVLEAIDIPYGASVADEKIRGQVLANRAMLLAVALRALDDGRPGVERRLDWNLAFMREQLLGRRECSLQQYEMDYAKVLAKLTAPEG